MDRLISQFEVIGVIEKADGEYITQSAGDEIRQKNYDLISRQATIKAIEERAKGIKNEDTLNGLAGAVAILFDLPTVVPKPCDDYISRKAVLDMWRQIICYDRTCPYRDEGRCTETFCDFKLFEYQINHMSPAEIKGESEGNNNE